ncbi:MAG: HK97 family phage prohead protease, partial [Synergistaceae bacterium]|nr:HK97 family phage prohead protease [Synergistaceae bacterium]
MSDFTLIEAANGAKPKVAGLAYGGGKMNLPGWKFPVVVDLAGMSIPENVPLLTNHENKTDARVGMVTASVKNASLEIAGEIVSDSKDAQDIVAQSKAGADWQLSIGADVRECELVKGSREVNGQQIDGPFYHVKKSVLREVSVVAVGADASTKMKVTAQFNLKNLKPIQGEVMTEENKNLTAGAADAELEKHNEPQGTPEVQAKAEVDVAATANDAAVNAVKAERERVGAIQSICNGEFPEIEKEAVSAGWTPEVTTKKVLETIRAERPSASVHVSVKARPEGGEMRKTIEAAMCLRCGVSADMLEKSYGAQTVEAGMADMDMPLRQLLIECMKMDGIPYSRGFDNETIRAAFSSVSLPGILSNVANKKLLQSYEAQPVIATKLCSTGDLNDFKENDRFRLTDVGDLLPV